MYSCPWRELETSHSQTPCFLHHYNLCPFSPSLYLTCMWQCKHCSHICLHTVCTSRGIRVTSSHWHIRDQTSVWHISTSNLKMFTDFTPCISGHTFVSVQQQEDVKHKDKLFVFPFWCVYNKHFKLETNHNTFKMIYESRKCRRPKYKIDFSIGPEVFMRSV